MPAKSISQSRARELLHYNSDTGVLTRKVRRGRSNAGDTVCSKNFRGYLIVKIDGTSFQSHRVIFLIQTGRMPTEIDHINGVKTDNRWSNLREVTHADNTRNRARPHTNTSGVCGVYWAAHRRKWVAYIGDPQQNLGGFDQKEDAIRARKAAERKLGYHPNHGR